MRAQNISGGTVLNVRAFLFRRDGGTCAACGLDCAALERRLERLLFENPSQLDAEISKLGMSRRRPAEIDRRTLPSNAEIAKFRGQLLEPNAVSIWEPGVSLWAAFEHEDGWLSLCWRCHRDKTAEGARRRAEQRKRPPPDEIFPTKRGQPPRGLFE